MNDKSEKPTLWPPGDGPATKTSGDDDGGHQLASRSFFIRSSGESSLSFSTSRSGEEESGNTRPLTLQSGDDEQSWEFTIETQPGTHRLLPSQVQHLVSSSSNSGRNLITGDMLTGAESRHHHSKSSLVPSTQTHKLSMTDPPGTTSGGGEGKAGARGGLKGSIRGSTRKSGKSKRLSEYTVDKLQFSKLGRLYGRDEEISELWQAWQEVSSAVTLATGSTNQQGTSVIAANDNTESQSSSPAPASLPSAGATSGTGTPRRFVTVSGPSGTGKSALAETLKHKVLRSGGMYVSGKFPQLLSSKGGTGGLSARHMASSVEPYAAFCSVCNELCDLVVSLDDDELQNPSWYQERTAKYKKYFKFTLKDLKRKLESDLGKDAVVLAKVIPVLLQILPYHPAGSGNNGAKTEVTGGDESYEVGYREGQHQFKFAFRKLLRIVSSFSPIVLVLDDLQWADAASMELLEAILTDRESSGGILVIGSYRDDDSYANMPHLPALASITSLVAQDPGLAVSSIHVGNLNVVQVNEMLVDLLSASSPDDTLGLAECVFKKTHGNVFFVIQFLTLLQDSELLEFSFGLMRWRWDLKAIQLQTAATENVVELMKAKMQGLPAIIGTALPIMACLGSTFSSAVFELVASHFTWEDDDYMVEVGTRGEADGDAQGQSDEAKASNGSEANPANAEKDTSQEMGGASSEKAPEQAAATMQRAHHQQPSAAKLLQFCEDQGLIERASEQDSAGHSSYQWVHDKIQEAACTLMSDEDLNGLKLELGKILFERFDDATLEKNLFIVANLLASDNLDPTTLPQQKPVDVARLFLRAGMKTIHNSAFDQARGYLLAGIRLLPPNSWHDHYELSLDLYSTSAEAEFCTGNFESMQKFADAVIEQTNRPLLDKRRVYNVMIDSTGAAGGQPAALALCRDILAKLGYRFPNRAVTLHVVAGIVQIKSTLKKTTSKQLVARLPAMEDPKTQWALVLLDKFITYAYMLKSDLLPLAIFKGMKLTIKQGIYFYSPVMFALVGLSLSAFVNDFKGGMAFGDQAVEMLNQVKSSRRVHSRVMFVVHCFVFNWLRPITLSIKPLVGGYEIGMATGDTESAAWCIYFSLEYSFRTGTPLETLIADCAFYSEQLREVKQLKIRAVLLNLWQTALLLTGENAFDGTFTGDIVKEAKALSEAGDFEAYLFVAINRVFMYVAFVLGKHKLVHESIKKTEMDNGGYEKVFPGIAGIYHLYAFNGLSMISLYRETRDKQYLKMAKKFAAKIRGWAMVDNPNVSHYAALMDAELDSLKGDNYAASKSYEVAILYAGRRGLTQDRALAHERYGEHLHRLGNEQIQDAQFQISEAIKLYEEWGAFAKVQLLGKIYLNLLSPPTEIQIETGG